MEPLWKINSGEFFGWRQGDSLYGVTGKHIGFLKAETAYLLNGEYLGEIIEREWIGRHAGRGKPRIGAIESRGAIRSVPRGRRSGRASRSWQDVEL